MTGRTATAGGPKRLGIVTGLVALSILGAACTAAAPAAPPAGSSAAAPTAPAAVRVIKHAGGETTVSGTPQRVVTLWFSSMDNAVALGVMPVGAVTLLDGSSFRSYDTTVLDKVTKVGQYSQPNLEAIASLKPDLILGEATTDKDVYGKLSQIAPTVLINGSGAPGAQWKDILRLEADALNRTSHADELLAAWDKRVADFKQKMGSGPSPTVSLIRALPTQVFMMEKSTFSGTIMDELGLRRPPAQDKAAFREAVTEERIADFDADILLLSRYPYEKETLSDGLKANPLWPQLKAVKNNHFYEVDDDAWIDSLGIRGANLVLDDLVKFVTPLAQ